MKFLVAIVLIAVAYLWTASLKDQGKIESVSGYLKGLFFDDEKGLKLTAWIDDIFRKR
jgi:hypothetical protein